MIPESDMNILDCHRKFCKAVIDLLKFLNDNPDTFSCEFRMKTQQEIEEMVQDITNVLKLYG